MPRWLSIRGPAYSCLGPRKPEIRCHSGMPYFFGFDFKAGFGYVAEVGLKLRIPWSQCPKCWGYGIFQPYLPSGEFLGSKTIDPKAFAREELLLQSRPRVKVSCSPWKAGGSGQEKSKAFTTVAGAESERHSIILTTVSTGEKEKACHSALGKLNAGDDGYKRA